MRRNGGGEFLDAVLRAGLADVGLRRDKFIKRQGKISIAAERRLLGSAVQ